MPPLKSAEIAKAIESLTDIVKALGEKLDAFMTSKPAEPILPPTPTVAKNLQPIPMEYRQIVDSVLNSNFGIEVEADAGQPAFIFSILVPEKYSNAGPNHWASAKEDRRPCVITYAESVNGVREWTEKVFNNLSQDAKTQIAIDRAEFKTA